MALRRGDAGGRPPEQDADVPDATLTDEPGVVDPSNLQPGIAPDSMANPDSVVAGRLSTLSSELAALRRLFEERLRYDEAREAHFGQIYEELDVYKRDEASERMVGLARGLILILDKLRDSDLPPGFIRGELEECLAREGVEVLPVGEDVPGTEEIVGFLAESDERDRVVVGEGFRFKDRIIRPRRVLVKKGTLRDP